MKYGISAISLLPVRKNPDHRSEMVNQLLFGESFSLIETEADWYFIRGTLDAYEGWVSKSQCMPLEEAPVEGRVNPGEVIPDTAIVSPVDKPGDIITILPGSTLPGFDPNTGVFRIGGQKYRLAGKFNSKRNLPPAEGIAATALLFINAPYLWGGRGLFGIDCSGLAQVAFKIWGISLPRDASQQVQKGKAVNFVSEAGPGDLAFFGDSDEEISHVGIILDGGRIVHASGKVRVDRFDHQGIFMSEKGDYSHSLRVIHNYLT